MPRRAALALLPLVPRTRTRSPLAILPRQHTRARERTIDDGRCDVRSAGVADWITVQRGNTEHTLAAAAGPSP